MRSQLRICSGPHSHLRRHFSTLIESCRVGLKLPHGHTKGLGENSRRAKVLRLQSILHPHVLHYRSEGRVLGLNARENRRVRVGHFGNFPQRHRQDQRVFVGVISLWFREVDCSAVREGGRIRLGYPVNATSFS